MSQTLEKSRKTGRPAIVTLETVNRIAYRVAKGLTKEQACLLETPEITINTLNSALRRNPTFAHAYARETASFLDYATDVLVDRDGIHHRRFNGIKLILERRYRDQWAPDVPTIQNTMVVHGLELPVVQSLRSTAKHSVKVVDVQQVEPAKIESGCPEK